MNEPSGSPNGSFSRILMAIKASAKVSLHAEVRKSLVVFSAEVFRQTGRQLELAGHIIGNDRKDRASPFGHGSDETTGVAILLRIGGELIAGSQILLQNGQPYAAAALLRQLVEIEYLAWAFEARDREAERWLRSDKTARQKFFTPKKLRDAAGDKFRSKDYGYHCELGGHPVPGARILLDDQGEVAQLLISDLLGHTGRIWDHVVGWAKSAEHGEIILARNPEMVGRFISWKRGDPLAHLPSPP